MTYSWKNGSLNQVTLAVLQNMLHDINPYVQVFQQTGRLQQQNSQNLTMIIADSRCYNVPTTSEIAAIIVGDNNNPSYLMYPIMILFYIHMREVYIVYLSYIEHMHYYIMFFFFQEGKMDGIQQFQSEMRHNHIFLMLKNNMKLMKTALILNLKEMSL
jgi:hypothetical protein